MLNRVATSGHRRQDWPLLHLHLSLGELGLLWIAEHLGDGGLDDLDGFAVGWPLMTDQFSSYVGLGLATGFEEFP